MARDRERTPTEAYRLREGVCEFCPLLPIEALRQEHIEAMLLDAAETAFQRVRMHLYTRSDAAGARQAYECFMRNCEDVHSTGELGCYYGMYWGPGNPDVAVMGISLFPLQHIPAENLIPAERVTELITSLGYERKK